MENGELFVSGLLFGIPIITVSVFLACLPLSLDDRFLRPKPFLVDCLAMIVRLEVK